MNATCNIVLLEYSCIPGSLQLIRYFFWLNIFLPTAPDGGPAAAVGDRGRCAAGAGPLPQPGRGGQPLTGPGGLGGGAAQHQHRRPRPARHQVEARGAQLCLPAGAETGAEGFPLYLL